MTIEPSKFVNAMPVISGQLGKSCSQRRPRTRARREERHLRGYGYRGLTQAAGVAGLHGRDGPGAIRTIMSGLRGRQQ